MKGQYKNDENITFHKFEKSIFYIKHTARDVEYKIDGFIEKNKDEVSQDIKKAIQSCLPAIVKIYYQEIQEGDVEVDFENQENNANAKEKFLAYNFTKDMNNLIHELTNSECFFVRCVKPNERK